MIVIKFKKSLAVLCTFISFFSNFSIVEEVQATTDRSVLIIDDSYGDKMSNNALITDFTTRVAAGNYTNDKKITEAKIEMDIGDNQDSISLLSTQTLMKAPTPEEGSIEALAAVSKYTTIVYVLNANSTNHEQSVTKLVERLKNSGLDNTKIILVGIYKNNAGPNFIDAKKCNDTLIKICDKHRSDENHYIVARISIDVDNLGKSIPQLRAHIVRSLFPEYKNDFPKQIGVDPNSFKWVDLNSLPNTSRGPEIADDSSAFLDVDNNTNDNNKISLAGKIGIGAACFLGVGLIVGATKIIRDKMARQ